MKPKNKKIKDLRTEINTRLLYAFGDIKSTSLYGQVSKAMERAVNSMEDLIKLVLIEEKVKWLEELKKPRI